MQNTGYNQKIVGSPFGNRFFLTKIKLNIGRIIYNGKNQKLRTTKITDSAFYKSNPGAFGPKITSDNEAIIMIDKLTGQLYVLHSENSIGTGKMKVTYDQKTQKYQWSLGKKQGMFTITSQKGEAIKVVSH